MPATRAVPPQLCGRPVTREELLTAGLSWAYVRAHFTALFRGVWWHGPPPESLVPWLHAALRILPPGSLVSHVSALQLRGIDLGGRFPVHFSTRSSHHTVRDGLVLHRRIGTIWLDEVRGLATTTPERAFVDSATLLGLRDLVRAGDALVHAGLVTLDQLRDFCVQSHLDGVVRARRAVALVREGVESFLETDVRLILVFARLPVDGCNVDILDDAGRFVARGDILFSRFKVLVEYDGWHHERDARQRQKDHLRRERLEAAGWIVVVVTIQDMKDPLGIVRRVAAALDRRGYRGPRPVMSVTWGSWFGAK